jgi:hypothetical protein
MHQTVYPKRRTRERYPRAESAHSVHAFPPREASGKRRAHHAAPLAGGPVDGVYDRFMRLPCWVVLAALWLLGMALLGSGVLVLYVLGTLLATLVG